MVHRRSLNDTTNDNEIPSKNITTTIKLDHDQSIVATTALEIGDTSSCDVTMEDEDSEEMDGLVEDLQRDVESLLSRPSSNKNGRHGSKCCRAPYKVGNCIVLLPSLYVRTGLGIIGPHWWGLLITFLLLFSGSSYFLRKAMLIGPITLSLTFTLTIVCTLALMRTGLSDPGIITGDEHIPPSKDDSSDQQQQLAECKWCDICNILQPSHAVHCPECNICIAQYDHHCPWMGTCIGRNNFRAFVIFNFSWISYLIFGISWIAASLAQEVN